MPQMSPILWLNLYLMFSITLVIFIAIFYYSKTPSSSPESAKAGSKQSLNWKW
uniref:ATP synthase complex subunit 8 n=1 Tax=Alpheus inopinatus TaxID=2302678 RepID=A0A411ATK3_9EUCA|nr:ATP synthase F0 subunit 8 [Alpheus inopinatus]QAX91337.1 ATP synthase F0 subunit 8 [Alpheus inopinatus]